MRLGLLAMRPPVLRSLLIAALALAAACTPPPRPTLHVLGVEQSSPGVRERRLKLFVEVVNRAREPLRLVRLRYVFSPGGTRDEAARGEVTLGRTIEPGTAAVVEVPISYDPGLLGVAGLTLRGALIAEQDQAVRSFPVTADVARDGTASVDPAGGEARATASRQD